MNKITVLGGAGTVGSFAARTLAASKVFAEIVIADKHRARGEQLVQALQGVRASFVECDAEDPASIARAVQGSSVVLNTAGPFYRLGLTILKTVIGAGVNYVDVCDDFEPTVQFLELDGEAKKRNVSALIGMGSSPGFANVLARFAADMLFDEIRVIDIYHAHGGEPDEGPAVVKHRLHSMQIGIPAFVDGKQQTVHLFEESGRALEEETCFHNVGTYPVYAYPHPETITLPRYIQGLRRVTNLGLVLPPRYAELIKGMARLGVTSEAPIDVGGQKVAPLDFAVAFILNERPRLMQEAGLAQAMGCLKIVTKGRKDGEDHTYVFSMSSASKGMGEGTGMPAAFGAILMATGKIKDKGVFPPEKGVNPLDAFRLLVEGFKAGKGETLPLYIEHIDANGNKEQVNPMSLFSMLM